MIRFDHIGYAVADIETYLQDFFVPLYGPTKVSPVYDDPIQKVRIVFVEVEPGVRIELIQPATPDSPVAEILKGNKGGLYHLCYETDDLDAEMRRFREKRCLPITKPAPAVAFDMRRVVFLLTPQRDMIELVEAP